MGCGSQIKKEGRRGLKKAEKVGKSIGTAYLTGGGIAATGQAAADTGAARKVDKLTGGKLGEAAEMGTGGAIQSQKTKELIAEGRAAEAAQQMEVDRIKSVQEGKDKKRRTRTEAQKKGRRSLLWAKGSELGVEKRATKLGSM